MTMIGLTHVDKCIYNILRLTLIPKGLHVYSKCDKNRRCDHQGVVTACNKRCKRSTINPSLQTRGSGVVFQSRPLD